jgi:hypothetical protein
MTRKRPAADRTGARKKPAGIEYVGLPGVSKDCQDAVMRLLQYGDRVTRAQILSSSGAHCLLLSINVGDLVAVKSGFSSGYSGEGPYTFSVVLQLLDAHGAKIEEHNVTNDVIDRVDSSALTAADLEDLEEARSVRPSRWHAYVREEHWKAAKEGTLWDEFPPVIPFAVIDNRIIDLAISFWDGPDDKLMIGYRRLEDTVRRRTRLEEHGSKLFSKAFGEGGKLSWKGIGAGERVGRASLFSGAYSAHRNRRAHREPKDQAESLLDEFLLLNHLYRLEKDSCKAKNRSRLGLRARAASREE